MRSSVKDITGRLEELCKQRIELGLQLTPGGASSNTAAQRRPPSSSVPTERTVFGRHQDKAKILEMVSANSPSGHANIAVIPIVGMGGIGKTTLAREVYNDKEVETFKFDIKAWVCVSEDFDVLSISRAILESITYSSCDLKALNEVQVQLKKAVDGKKIFLVLDDVWNEDYGLWEDLKAPLMGAAPNSKIVVTTRHSHVASTMEPTQQYNLRCLSDEDCWSLFMMHAFVSRDLTAQQISDLFRNKVVGKCRGLPLAAKALGGLLRSKRHDAWDEILNNKILDLPRQSGILAVLNLSYHYLPSHLKRCFSYCAIFPKGYKFEEKELVFLWMAEGIIQQSRNNKNQPEVLGREYFHELVSRSILQPSSSNNSKFVMHDLVHDLAQLVSGQTNFRWEEANKSISSVQKSRHFSYNCSVNDGNNMLDVVHEVQHLRTFLPVSVSSSGRYDMNDLVVSNLLSKCGKLRVLSLSRSYITELPKGSMSGWKHLRYLNLSDTRIRNLPKSTCSLINLQVLLLRDCYYLLKLPSKLRNLINLRHLDIMGAYLIKEMPFGMKELKNLQALSNFIVGTDTKSSGLKDLKSLAFVGGELSISGLENVIDPWEASEAMLCEKQYLEALSLQWRSQLQWGSQFDDSRNESREELVLGKLKPCTSIKKLTIKGYGGKKIPSWIADPSFSKMEVLGLENCENCTSLPSFGLLSSLKHLTVKGLRKLKSMGYGEHCSNPFQSLETLWFEDLPEWEYWDTKFEENGNPGCRLTIHFIQFVRW
ncbi:hypothetical protein WN944_015610 [Citrus x changshan-huyou]|uniref:NB-ARC domain-containing protein n=1 Tax=Citrus x changshan-huyou TaxID=2935761 RepID=A0AAP0MAI8_9ROSI